jgi:Raf kinase inhibitor-like YbhB/YbcL family protein
MIRLPAFVVALLLGATAPVLAAPFTLTSPAVSDGARVPTANAGPDACLGQNVSLPLRWTDPPAATKSFAVVVYDIDGRSGTGTVHWVAYGIAPETRELPAGFGTHPSPAFIGGTNTRNVPTYFGPCGRPGDSPHHYSFTVIACDIDTRSLAPGLTRDALFAALQGHALSSATLVLTYGR